MDERVEALEESLAKARAETREAFVNRALMVAHIFDAMEEELGTERAVALMKRAIYRRGLEIGERYRAAGRSRDLAEAARLFVEGSASDGALFAPSVEEVDEEAGRLVLRMNACVHKDAWREAGYPEERVDLLCDVASSVDFGTFEGAGFALRFLDRQACPGSDRCLLELTFPETSPGSSPGCD